MRLFAHPSETARPMWNATIEEVNSRWEPRHIQKGGEPLQNEELEHELRHALLSADLEAIGRLATCWLRNWVELMEEDQEEDSQGRHVRRSDTQTDQSLPSVGCSRPASAAPSAGASPAGDHAVAPPVGIELAPVGDGDETYPNPDEKRGFVASTLPNQSAKPGTSGNESATVGDGDETHLNPDEKRGFVATGGRHLQSQAKLVHSSHAGDGDETHLNPDEKRGFVATGVDAQRPTPLAAERRERLVALAHQQTPRCLFDLALDPTRAQAERQVYKSEIHRRAGGILAEALSRERAETPLVGWRVLWKGGGVRCGPPPYFSFF